MPHQVGSITIFCQVLFTLQSYLNPVVYIREAVNFFKNACKQFSEEHLVKLDKSNQLAVRKLNDKLIQLDRFFVDPRGLPDHQHFQYTYTIHQLSEHHITYSLSFHDLYQPRRSIAKLIHGHSIGHVCNPNHVARSGRKSDDARGFGNLEEDSPPCVHNFLYDHGSCSFSSRNVLNAVCNTIKWLQLLAVSLCVV